MSLLFVLFFTVTCISLSAISFSFFFDFWAWIPELGPENKTPRRKFHEETDFHVKNNKFQRPEVNK